MDKKDPICGMQGSLKAYGHYFCCEGCIRKYESLHRIEKGSRSVQPVKWHKERLFQVIFCLVIIQVGHLILNYFGITVLQGLVFSFYEYVRKIWLAVLLGLLLGGFIDFFIPSEYITKYLALHKKRTIFYSVGLGFLMTACSHGILAISMELYKKGASTSAVIAFLLASPWANLPVTILLFGFFGVKALLFVIFAIVIALITGLTYQVLEKKGMIESNTKRVKEEGFSILEDVKMRWRGYKFSLAGLKEGTTGVLRGSWDLTKMVLWWILIGIFLASMAKAYIPHNFFMKYMGPTMAGLFVTLIIATIIEICSEGTAPLAFEIFRQTKAFGNSFVFLMAGVVTDYTELGLIWANIGKRAAIWLPVITVPQVVILGWLFNILL